MTAPDPACRWLPPRAPASLRTALARAGTPAIPLVRRGAHHGYLVPAAEGPLPAADVLARWRSDRPVLLRGVLRARIRPYRQALGETLRLFARLRRGARFFDWVIGRLAGQGVYQSVGSSIDLGDPREVEKAFARARGARRGDGDLWAKLAWIAHDPRDPSLRIRFSWGVEALQEWHRDPRQARRADGLAAALFPECAVLGGHRLLFDLLRHLTGGPVRLSERIVYNNVPGGGAVFHHDAEATQLGVCFGQLAGETAWLALPRRELAEVVAEVAHGRATLRRFLGTPARAFAALKDTREPRLDRLLNRDPVLTRRLVERGAAFRMRAGDAVLLPSHSREDVAWHSVFGIGRSPSLAHSYGIFAAAPSRHGRRSRANPRAPGTHPRPP
ncbi:MAG: hypothetical protein IT458_16655 [Planctomycetes bacterium]|nr:hypothetical protein [Planctomycetota bacterium]